ncbi:hypothetical protein EYF80_047047 [Liparis tanakae]|uniref:Uncharacterized protein n=1 Tax=Liparis tanakae TaxID=230148 RepID=A0A4Z2FNQ9_9TELE|nr:hypothetical protein EYF80_047047 [Liparis tanakae]
MDSAPPGEHSAISCQGQRGLFLPRVVTVLGGLGRTQNTPPAVRLDERQQRSYIFPQHFYGNCIGRAMTGGRKTHAGPMDPMRRGVTETPRRKQS